MVSLTEEQLERQKAARQSLLDMGFIEVKLLDLVKDYEEYEALFKDDLVVAVRKVLKRLADKGDHDFEDSDEHNALVKYFNKFGLHRKLTKKDVETWQHFQEPTK